MGERKTKSVSLLDAIYSSPAIEKETPTVWDFFIRPERKKAEKISTTLREILSLLAAAFRFYPLWNNYFV